MLKNSRLRIAQVSPLWTRIPLACGTPVVAHRRGSVGEVVEDGVTGYAATSLDALLELVGPALLLDRAKVRVRAEARFGYRRMADDYLALYRALLAG